MGSGSVFPHTQDCADTSEHSHALFAMEKKGPLAGDRPCSLIGATGLMQPPALCSPTRSGMHPQVPASYQPCPLTSGAALEALCGTSAMQSGGALRIAVRLQLPDSRLIGALTPESLLVCLTACSRTMCATYYSTFLLAFYFASHFHACRGGRSNDPLQ